MLLPLPSSLVQISVVLEGEGGTDVAEDPFVHEWNSNDIFLRPLFVPHC